MLASILLHNSNCSHNTDLVGNIKGIHITGESNVGFLLASWSVKSVNLSDLDLVKLLACLSDHFLVGFFVDKEDKGVVIFNCLDGRFRAQWVLDNSVFVECVLSFDSSKKDLCASLLDSGLWSSESGVGPYSSFSGSMSAFLDSSSSRFSSLKNNRLSFLKLLKLTLELVFFAIRILFNK